MLLIDQSQPIDRNQVLWTLSVCAPVSSALSPAPATHAPVGYGAVAIAAPAGTTPERSARLLARDTQLQGTGVFAAKKSVKNMNPVGGVRGIPPRGRPV